MKKDEEKSKYGQDKRYAVNKTGWFRKYTALVLATLFAALSVLGCRSEVPGGDLFVSGGEVKRLTPELTVPTLEADMEIISAQKLLPVADYSMEFMRRAAAAAREEGMENPVLSPVSVYIALLLAGCGSNGGSRAEFEQLLGVPAEEWAFYGGRLMKYMNWSKNGDLVRTANSVWFDDGTIPGEEYLELASKELQAEIFQGELSSDTIVKAINRWVNDRTDGMIPVLRSEPYDNTTAAVLLNAVYLEAVWKDSFQGQNTQIKNFTTGDGREISTLFLCDWGCRREYVQGDGMEGILLPYTDGRLAFLALRSTDGRGAGELLDSLTAEQLRTMAAGADCMYMNFSMPKFTLEYQQGLNDVVKQMGLVNPLSPETGDLSGMGTTAEGFPLYISGISQLVKVQVDEEGTKAAAVTEVTQAAGAMEPAAPPLELHFDSPYLYLIMDTETGLPLFMGILECPEEAAE